MPSDARYAVAKRSLERNGYYFDRCKGSHHTFVKPGIRSVTFPVHRVKVKYVYVKQIEGLP